MKNLYKVLITLIVSALSLTPTILKASHLTGADFQYICVGHGGANDTILLRAHVFRDCAGISAPPNLIVPIVNSCGVLITVTMLPTAVTGIEVSFLCGTLLPQSTCNGGTLPGMQIYTYEVTVILPASCNGQLQVNSTGGSPGFNYSWPMGLTGSDVDLLCAGAYTVTVQDNNGCIVSDTHELKDVTNLYLTPTVSEVSCNGICDGSISVAVSNGTAPYVYNWQDGFLGASRTNLCPGFYSVTVMDANGSQYAHWITLNNPAPVLINFTVEDESCSGACDGIIRTDVSGGTAPYTFAWTGGLTGSIASSVCPGTYNVVVTDANGCTSTAAATVSGAAVLNSSFTLNTAIVCNSTCNGSVTATATGGTTPYTFNWDNGFTGNTRTGLCAGTYQVTTTDANGCMDVQNINVTQPTPIVANPTINNSACSGTTGSISLLPSGGTGPYTYLWSTTATGATLTSVGLGTYTVTITDGSGCTKIQQIGMGEIGASSGSGAVVTAPSCSAGSNGNITVSPIGGSAPYTFLWSTGATTSSITSLTAGDYVVTITSTGGCAFVDVIEVVDPTPLAIDVVIIDPTCNGNCDGSISVTPSGGTGGYNFLWSNGGTGVSQINLCSGTYSFTVTDGNGCTLIQNNINVTDPAVLQDSIAVVQPIDCNANCNGHVKALPTGGTAPFTFIWSNGAVLADNYDLCVGSYMVTITDANGCVVLDTINLTQPLPIVTTITQVASPGCTGTWTGGWGSCCRPAGAVNITAASSSFYADFTMNTSMAQGDCNSGGLFEENPSAHPLRYVCLNDTMCYNFGVTEPDGDSLVFLLIPAKTGATTIATYNLPYSGTNPINGITLNPSTGEICFVATPAGRFVVTIQVSEYDPVTGLFKGRNMRDILFITEPCPPNAAPTGSMINNFTSTTGSVLTNPTTIDMCEGDEFCFEIEFLDSNLYDTTMFAFSNVRDLLVGPNPGDTATYTNTVLDTVTINGVQLMRITSTICWTAPPLSGGVYNFYVAINDDHCTVPEDFFRAITINVTGSTVAWPNTTICGNQTAQIFSAGGTAFSWQSIFGAPIVVGTNFSCDSCAAPVASPSTTTVYVVTSNINSNCQNMDTVTIIVAPDYQVIATPDTILCNLDTVNLSASATIPGVFTYQWNNAATLSSTTIYNPVATPQGSTIYSVTMTSVDGCEKNSVANVFITPPFPVLNPIATDSVLCGIGDTTQLFVEFLTSNTSTCGGSYSQCLSTTDYTILGLGGSFNTSTSFTNTAPFGNFRKSSKQQYLFKASELKALGLKAGMITEIGFNVASINGSSTYEDYEVKMGCSPDTFFVGAFKPVPTVVFPAAIVNLTTGWNMLVFTTPYIWDGNSSIIIDVCFDMLSANSTQNSSTYYNNPGFTSCVYYNNNFANACNSAAITNASFSRPNVRFGFCSGADTAAYTYNWLPYYNLSDTSIIDPIVWPDSTTTYSVIVNDTFGVCSDTANITIYVGEIETGLDTILCAGDSIVLNALITTICPNGTENYSWFPTTGLNDPTILNPVATAFATTTYVLTYTNSCGCTLTDSITITVNPFGLPNPIFTDPTCGLSDGEILLQSVGGTAPLQFSIDSGMTYMPTNLFINLPMGRYEMIIMDSNGCLSPLLIDTLINPGTPVVDSIVLTNPSCFGFTDGQISIYSQGGTAPIRYSIDSINFTINSMFTGLGSGNYTVIVQDDSLCRTFPQQVTINSNSELFLDSINYSDLNCYQDSSGWMELFGHGGTTPYTYTISNGITYSPNALFANLSMGAYPVIIKDSLGCTTTMQIQNIGEPLPLVSVVTPVNDTCYNACGGMASVVVSGGTQPYFYSWRKGVNQIGSNASDISGLCVGADYEFKVVDSNNCELFSPFVINHPDQLIVSTTVDNISCFGVGDGRVLVSAVGGTAPYQYSIDGGVSYVSNPLFTGLVAGTYNVMVADSGMRCDAMNTAIINEPSEITLTTNITSKKLCVAGCTQLVATAVGGVGAPYNYIWNQGLDSNGTQTACPTATTIYSVYAADSNGCTSIAHGIVLSLYDSLVVDAGPDHDLCPGDTAQLTALVTGGDGNGYNFIWSPVSGLSGGYIQDPLSYPLASTLYTVRVSDNCSSPAVIDSVWVNIHPKPTMGFYADGPTEGCEPFNISLVNTSVPVQFAEWTIGEDIKAHGFKVDITDLKDGIYDVKLRVISTFGCSNEMTETDFITVYPLPEARFNINPEKTTIFNTIIQFEDKSIGSINAWEWDFAGFGNSTDQNPVFQFPADTGDFPVTLKVTSVKGCEDTQEEILRIGGEFNVYVPNSFTPNGDGQNDVFAPRAVGIDNENYKLLIYDRWGGLIFESANLNQPWDGRVQGTNKMAANGSYVWRIVAQDNTDNPEGHVYRGTVTLIR